MEKKKYNFPEVKLGQYKGLAITRHVRPVTEKTLDIEMVHQTRMHAVYHPTTAPAKRGFRALLDFAGYMDGKEIPDSRMENVMVVLGDGKLMPAAEQAIYGHCAGEVFRFDFTYPQDFRLPELSGKTAQFEINLRSLAEKVTPAPDEAFAKSLGFGSLDALKADLRAKKQKIHEEGADRAEALEYYGLTPDLPVILVVGGSLGTRSLNEMMKAWIVGTDGKAPVQVIWQTGKYYEREMQAFLAAHPAAHVWQGAFIDRMDYAYAAADLVVSRSGAGTVSELCLVAKPVLFVPSPNVAEDHQTKNARALETKGAAVVVPDAECQTKAMPRAVELLADRETLAAMSRNLEALARPDAAEDIVNEIVKVMK